MNSADERTLKLLQSLDRAHDGKPFVFKAKNDLTLWRLRRKGCLYYQEVKSGYEVTLKGEE